MTIFAAPAAFRMATLEFIPRDTVADVFSIYSGKASRLDFGGQWWEATAETPPLTWDQAAELEAWASRLRRDGAVAQFPVDGFMTRRGTTTAATVTASAALAGASALAVAGLGAGATLLAGSMISDAEGRLYMVEADATADGSGAATLSLFPRFRQAVAGGAVFRLAGGAGVLSSWILLERPGHGFAAGLGRTSAGENTRGKSFRFAEAFL